MLENDPADVPTGELPHHERVVRIAHLSDPHFGTIRPSIERAMLETLRDIGPDMVVISGDITQRARTKQFAAAGAFVEALAPVPCLAVPGNHDIPLYNLPARLFHPYRGFRDVFGDEVAPVAELPGVQIVTFVSAPRWRHKNGDISVAAVRSRLRRLPRQEGLRIGVFHHPFDSFEHIDEKNLIRRSGALLEVLTEHRVDLVLGGHIHDSLARTTVHRYPQLSRHLVLALAGTCMSWRTRYRTPNTFNLLELCPARGELKVERWDCGETDGRVRFHSVTHDRFCRDTQGWAAAGGGAA